MEREEMRYEANFAAKRFVLTDLLSSSARLTWQRLQVTPVRVHRPYE